MRKSIIAVVSITLLLVVGVVASALAAGTFTAKEKAFMKKAAADGVAEMQLGQLAQTNAKTQEVKDFGSRMVTDHGKANDELTAIAQQKGLTLPSAVNRKHKMLADKLNKLTGDAFDRAYMREMVKEHMKDVATFKKAQKNAQDSDLQGWIGKTLPILEDHLKNAKEIASRVGAGGDGKGGQIKEGM
ncbi:DUF4142 domain-containing protein [Geomesophilobacter sediminis]|uniref:DUF4142 domain-containing protein n=1 Tax=Geomesophilobacter sediminis TaxID=2798584 RepID=A0A8J7JBX3_9BACT|nr:DUF4142 domain-containing protein [Geomesophilobacter sediminis]MBJ6724731.1 DUF4142 domain-containing protein [Geomesophilobacter sediminis]